MALAEPDLPTSMAFIMAAASQKHFNNTSQEEATSTNTEAETENRWIFL
jgi:hypothetical protein